MQKIKVNTTMQNLPGSVSDLTTPVSIYLKIRDRYPNTLLLESSDYHGNKNSMSYICFNELANFMVSDYKITMNMPNGTTNRVVTDKNTVADSLNEFIKTFDVEDLGKEGKINGVFGYTAYDGIKYFENIKLSAPVKSSNKIPEIRYSFYQYIIAFNHFNNNLFLIENKLNGGESNVDDIIALLLNRSVSNFKFTPLEEETSNLTDEEYMQMVTKGKEHCNLGDVFQIVLSRQFAQKFAGDEFNVYRALRRINPSPYLFYYDFGGYKIFGSSPEAQLIVEKDKAIINPIAGTFKRTGDDEKDRILAEELAKDKKENAEHVMLVDLARNDLSRNSDTVTVDTYREVQYYSHVLHLVSEVSGVLKDDINTIKVFGDSFPAGTLSGAPKYKAMELIDTYENQGRSYYGGAIGMISFNGDINQAIMIRSFLSKDKTLFYQAGAGIVSESKEESELQEVNNKLGALKSAIEAAKLFNLEIL